MLAINLPSEPTSYLAGMITLTMAFGGVGAVFMFSFLGNLSASPPLEGLSKAVTLGLALVMVLVGGLGLFRIPVTRINVLVAVLSALAVSTISFFGRRLHLELPSARSGNHDLTENVFPIGLVFILLLFRLIQFGDALVPVGQEGLIHTSLLREFSGQPAIPFSDARPVGFYAIASVVHSFWGLSHPGTMLLAGQWLSTVCGLSFYAFALRHIPNPYAAGLSFVIYSFTLLFPAHLLSWGRYPLLLGLAVLPPAMITSEDSIGGRKSSFLAALLLVIALGLTHLGLLLVWVSYMLVSLAREFTFGSKMPHPTVEKPKRPLTWPFLLLLSASLLILSGILDVSLVHDNSPSLTYDPVLGFGSQYVSKLLRAHDGFFLFLWTAWILWSVASQRKWLHISLLWSLAAWFLTWLLYAIVGVPILTYIDLIVVLSVPLAISVGLISRRLLTLLIKLGSPNDRPLSRFQLKRRYSILLMIGILTAIVSSPMSIDQTASIFDGDDMLAMNWIRANTAKDAGFLIRSASQGNNVLIPSDGGGWISFLTGRRTVIPGIGELYDICEFAMEHGVNYLYFGRERGSDGFDLRLSDMSMENYTVVYGTSAVEIVSLRCPG